MSVEPDHPLTEVPHQPQPLPRIISRQLQLIQIQKNGQARPDNNYYCRPLHFMCNRKPTGPLIQIFLTNWTFFVAFYGKLNNKFWFQTALSIPGGDGDYKKTTGEEGSVLLEKAPGLDVVTLPASQNGTGDGKQSSQCGGCQSHATQLCEFFCERNGYHCFSCTTCYCLCEC
jgi:hypothetical protein